MENTNQPNSNIEKYGNPTEWRFNPVSGEPLHRGLQNWKMLFRKPTFSDWITLFIIAMAIVGAYMYEKETKTCRETLNNLATVCQNYLTYGQGISPDRDINNNPLAPKLSVIGSNNTVNINYTSSDNIGG